MNLNFQFSLPLKNGAVKVALKRPFKIAGQHPTGQGVVGQSRCRVSPGFMEAETGPSPFAPSGASGDPTKLRPQSGRAKAGRPRHELRMLPDWDISVGAGGPSHILSLEGVQSCGIITHGPLEYGGFEFRVFSKVSG